MSGLQWLAKRKARRALIVETEAFLSGTAQELYVLDAKPVPVWARLNALAHGGPEVVHAMAANLRGLDTFGTWAWAVSTLANELLEVSRHSSRPLDQVQRASIVPLELVLLDPAAAEPSPRMLVAVGTAAIRAQVPPIE